MYDPKEPKNPAQLTNVEDNQDKELNKSAFEEAQHDIDDDAEFTPGNDNDDLDEEESRELGDMGLGF